MSSNLPPFFPTDSRRLGSWEANPALHLPHGHAYFIGVIASTLRQTILCSIFLLACRWASAQASSAKFPVGTVIPKVTCSGEASQSYALYLPSNFSGDRNWPVIYVFDPGARGAAAAEVIRPAAEKFGYIVAASNNSRNGPDGGSAEAARAMWQDTQARFPLANGRRYFAGMSGGARVAAALALSCQSCVAGVIANAAGPPVGQELWREMKFAYFAAVGNADFNYTEFVQLRPKLDEAGARYRIRVFDGPHGWAPPEVWLEALQWMDLQAMSSGAMRRDAARIQESFNREMEAARVLEARKEMLAALRDYQSIVRDFGSLGVDVSVARSRAAALKSDKLVQAAEKQEKAEAAEQGRLVAEASAPMQAIASNNLGLLEFAALKRKFADLKRQAAGGSDRHSLVLRRVLGGLVVAAYESGQRALEEKNTAAALQYFDLAGAGSADGGWAHYLRARAYAAASDKKNMLAELRQAAAAGFHSIAALNAQEFDSYREQPEFQAVLAEWKKQTPPESQ